MLVVEDEDPVRQMSVDALREVGYTVIQAANGAQALETMALEPRVDLLFTDIVIPDMSGLRLAELARQARPSIAVLYTTGYSPNAVIQNLQRGDGVVLLQKPFTLADLARKVRQVLDGQKELWP